GEEQHQRPVLAGRGFDRDCGEPPADRGARVHEPPRRAHWRAIVLLFDLIAEYREPGVAHLARVRLVDREELPGERIGGPGRPPPHLARARATEAFDAGCERLDLRLTFAAPRSACRDRPNDNNKDDEEHGDDQQSGTHRQCYCEDRRSAAGGASASTSTRPRTFGSVTPARKASVGAMSVGSVGARYSPRTIPLPIRISGTCVS